MLPTKEISKIYLRKIMQTKGNGSKDYSKTLSHWKNNFNKNWFKIKSKKFDDKFNRLWNYYLDYCETGFTLNRTDVTQFFLKKIK